MIDLLENIYQWLSTVGTFIETEIESLFIIVSFAPEALAAISYALTFAPSLIAGFISMIIAIKILYIVLGR